MWVLVLQGKVQGSPSSSPGQDTAGQKEAVFLTFLWVESSSRARPGELGQNKACCLTVAGTQGVCLVVLALTIKCRVSPRLALSEEFLRLTNMWNKVTEEKRGPRSRKASNRMFMPATWREF